MHVTPIRTQTEQEGYSYRTESRSEVSPLRATEEYSEPLLRFLLRHSAHLPDVT
jgi:hypothetical protein